MSKRIEEIEVKYTSDTKDYVKDVNKANEATKGFDESITDVDGNTTKLDESLGGFGDSLESTTEGAIDAATGFSGMGSAVIATSKSLVVATRSLSAMQKALVATGFGAIVVALGAIVAYWEDIVRWIGLSNDDLEEQERILVRIEAQEKKVSEAQQKRLKDRSVFTQQIANDLKKAQLDGKSRLQLLKLEAKLLNDLSLTRFQKTQEERDALFLTIEEIKQEIKILENEIIRFENRGQETSETKGILETMIFGQYADKDELFLETQEAMAGLARITDEFNQETERKKKISNQNIAASNKELSDQTMQHALFAASGVLKATSDNMALIGALMIGEAIANTALALTNIAATAPAPAIPFLQAQAIITGAASVATIAANMGASNAGTVSTISTGQVPSTPTETAANTTLFRVNPPKAQIVLVTDDLNTVQQRVAVTNDRASLG